jgi:hypothetical protein
MNRPSATQCTISFCPSLAGATSEALTCTLRRSTAVISPSTRSHEPTDTGFCRDVLTCCAARTRSGESQDELGRGSWHVRPYHSEARPRDAHARDAEPNPADDIVHDRTKGATVAEPLVALSAGAKLGASQAPSQRPSHIRVRVRRSHGRRRQASCLRPNLTARSRPRALRPRGHAHSPCPPIRCAVARANRSPTRPLAAG